MKNFRNLAIGCLVLFLGAGLARADQKDRRTIVNVPYPVQVDQFVLQPGEYMIRLAEPSNSVTLVQILSSDGNRVVATVHGIPVRRSRISEKTQFWFWKTPRGRPRLVRAWFYPGQDEGVEVITQTAAR